MFKPINFEFWEERHETEVRDLNWLRLNVNASLYFECVTFEELRKFQSNCKNSKLIKFWNLK